MSTKQRELLHSQMNAEEVSNLNSSMNELQEREQITGSPYWIIGNKELGYMLTFAKYQFNERLPTKMAVRDYLEENMYDIILKTVLSAIELKMSKMDTLIGKRVAEAYNKLITKK